MMSGVWKDRERERDVFELEKGQKMFDRAYRRRPFVAYSSCFFASASSASSPRRDSLRFFTWFAKSGLFPKN